MRDGLGHHETRWTPILLALICILTFPAPDAPGETETENKSENRYSQKIEYEHKGGGFDPHAFRNAEQMLDIAPHKDADADLHRLLMPIDSEMISDATMERDALWSLLLRIEPYRCNETIQESVPIWVSMIARTQRTGTRQRPADLLAQANAVYVAGNLEEASERYRDILRDYHRDPTARNNLALAQMHLGHDLIAQMEWETLLKLEPKSLPARINLTVLYTRLGLAEKARAMSRALVEQNRRIPMAAFNEAWFLAGENALDAALDLMAVTGAADGVPARYAVFRRQLEAMTTPPPERPPRVGKAADSGGQTPEGFLDRVLDRGLAGMLGGRTSVLGWIVSVLVFTFLSFVVLGLAAQGTNSGFLFLVFGGLLYGLTWGMPQGLWWVPAILYLLFGIAMASAD